MPPVEITSTGGFSVRSIFMSNIYEFVMLDAYSVPNATNFLDFYGFLWTLVNFAYLNFIRTMVLCSFFSVFAGSSEHCMYELH